MSLHSDNKGLTYMIPLTGKVQLVVFDAQGKEVACLVDSMQAAGRHTIDWPHRKAMAAGAYMVKLTCVCGDSRLEASTSAVIR
jgi:hypothetical protein